MTTLLVELKCPEHGLERFRIKVIKKYNITPDLIMPKYRTRPKYELSSIIVGRSVNPTDAKDYLVKYFRESGLMNQVLSIRLQV